MSMYESKLEIIKYQKIKHIKVFVNKVNYVAKHVHNDIEIFIVLSGKGLVKFNSAEHSFSEGDMFLINSGEPHSLSFVADKNDSKSFEGVTSLFIQISNHFLRDYFPLIQTLSFDSINLKKELKKEEYKKMLSLLIYTALNYFSGKDYFELEILFSVSKILYILLKNVNYKIINKMKLKKIQNQQERIKRIVSFIDENLDSKIKLEDIAKKENISVSYLSHLFSSELGMTFQDFVNELRIEQCIRLMANKYKTLLEICYDSGFSNPKYMKKVFVEKFGCSPKEYRDAYSNQVSDSQMNTGKLEVIYSDADSLEKVKEFSHKFNLDL
ncbi:MAG: AraC family transcriptional regulator [Bacillales bacterium]|nr:AraC family transcriptional regulator [Bacillales bacterium]